jgi:hypothetical protein
VKPRTKLSLIVAVTLVIGFVVGGFVGSRLASRHDVEVLEAVELSHSALKTTDCIMLLKGIRDDKQDLVTDRLESLLDSAIIRLARDYTPSRDYYGAAAKSLQQAREYRAAHPHKSTLPRVEQEVQAALAKQTQSPPSK